jgi:hypothetical protein
MRWMTWISENIFVVLAIAGAIATWLNQRRRAKQGLPPVDEDGQPLPGNRPTQASFEETDDAERTRRIQEEIRRKIAERRGESGPPAAPPEPPVTIPAPVRREATPPPVFHDPVQEMMKEMQNRFSPGPDAPAPAEPPIESAQAAGERETLTRQRELEEKLQALEAQQRTAQQRAAEIKATDAAAATGRESASRAAADRWLTELRDPQTARRAIVLREILGTPVGLR